MEGSGVEVAEDREGVVAGRIGVAGAGAEALEPSENGTRVMEAQ